MAGALSTRRAFPVAGAAFLEAWIALAQSYDLSVSGLTGPGSGAVGVPLTVGVGISAPAGASGVTVTAIFQPAVTFNASNSTAGCAANAAAGDVSTTVTCPVAGLSSASINVTPLQPVPLNVVAGVMGNEADPVMSNNSLKRVFSVSPAVTNTPTRTRTPTPTGTLKATPTRTPTSKNTAVPTNTPTAAPGAARFYTVSPCRVLDTRNSNGPLGGPALAANTTRTFAVVNQCGVPATAKSVSVNVTITAPSAAGSLSLYPAGIPLPNASTINYRPGQTRANNAILTLGSVGDFNVYCGQASGTVHFILDVSGYLQ